MSLTRVDCEGRMRLETLESGYRFAVDVDGFALRLDSGADAQAPSPVQALLAALAACQAMDVIGILRKKRLHVTAYEIAFRGERAVEHPRRFVAIDIVHRVTGPDVKLAAVREAVQLSETKYCSVHHTLRPDLVVAVTCEVLPG